MSPYRNQECQSGKVNGNPFVIELQKTDVAGPEINFTTIELGV